MAALLRRWQWILLAAVFAALFLPTVLSTARGGRVLFDALQPAESFARLVSQREITVAVMGLADLSMTLYTAIGDEPTTTLVLVHGATAQGRNDRRLRSLACALALAGTTVACPQLDALAAFSVDEDDIDRLVAATLAAAEASHVEQVGLLGISIGGSYAVVAAGRPELSGRLTALFTFGAAADLDESVIDWLADGGSQGGEALRGRRALLLANLAELIPPDEVSAVREALLSPGPSQGLADRELALSLSEASRTALALGRDPALADAKTVRAVFAPLRTPLEAGSPTHAPGFSKAPTFLAHAVADPLVPVAHLSRLAFLLAEAGTPVRIEVTEIFDHVDALSEPGWLAALPLARFFGRFLDAAEG